MMPMQGRSYPILVLCTTLNWFDIKAICILKFSKVQTFKKWTCFIESLMTSSQLKKTCKLYTLDSSLQPVSLIWFFWYFKKRLKCTLKNWLKCRTESETPFLVFVSSLHLLFYLYSLAILQSFYNWDIGPKVYQIYRVEFPILSKIIVFSILSPSFEIFPPYFKTSKKQWTVKCFCDLC